MRFRSEGRLYPKIRPSAVTLGTAGIIFKYLLDIVGDTPYNSCTVQLNGTEIG